MNPLADIVLKVSLILSTAIGLSMALRGKSAALRHWVLSVGIVCAVTAPCSSRSRQCGMPRSARKWPEPPQNVPLMVAPMRASRRSCATREARCRVRTAPGQSAGLPCGSC